MLPNRQSHGPVRLRARIGPRTLIASVFVALAMLLGGGGSSAPVSELLLELAAAVTAGAWLFIGYRRNMASLPQDRMILVIAGLAFALPLMQLLPLPPAIWQMLPGRESTVEALRLVGADGNWMPWSMTPSRTFAALLSIMPPVLAMLLVASLDHKGRRLVIATIAALALASLVLGALQLSAGSSGAWRPYGMGNEGYLNGFQANRNAQADILLIGMVALAAALAHYRRELGEPMAAASLLLGMALLALGCLAVGSRTGIALLPVSAIAVAVIWIRRGPGPRAIMGAGLVAALGALGSLLLYSTNDRVANAIDWFAFSSDPREQIWAETMFAIGRYWPFGSGLGSFKPIYIANERLEFVDIFYPTAAHNDYLELALEGGIFGLALLAIITALVGRMIYCSFRGKTGGGTSQTVFATSTLIIIASHSVVDYPLRSMAIACIAGTAVGLLSALPKGDKRRGYPAA